jgi:tubulin polyglutamylase TTLL5
VANIVTDVFSNHLEGWEELPQGLGLGTSWNVLWSWAKPRINIKHLNMFQKINHFHDSKQLTRKDLLKKNLGRLTDVAGNKTSQQFEIMPKTFLLPNEYTSFVREYTAIEAMKNDPSTPDPDGIKNIWIMKPVGLSRGRGISLVQDITSLTYSSTSVLQKYVDRPLCLAGYKFDLRLYIVVTSFQPLEAFIYDDGFARVSTEKYRVDGDSLSNQFIHLTNSSIQKNSVTGPTTDNPLMQGDVSESNGSKIGLKGSTGLWVRLRKEGINVEQVWSDICLLVVKSLVAVDDKIEHQPCCFELFGYDVLLDADLRPWLIEVNASPSLARSNQLDVRVKNNLIKDIIQLVDPPPFDRMAFAKIMRKRLKDIQNKSFSMGKGDPTLERDLRLMLGDHIPRRYGEEPKVMGDFERLAPNTKMHTLCVKLKGKLVKGAN